MNKLLNLSVFIFLIIFQFGYSQYSNPNITLTSGLDNIAFNKGKLDVETLTKIIKEKQKEILREGLKISYHKSLDKIKDPFTKHYFQQIISIFFNETNHKVITKQILKETTQYVFLISMSKFIDNNLSEIHQTINSKVFSNETETISSTNKLIATYIICKKLTKIQNKGLINNEIITDLENNENFKKIKDYINIHSSLYEELKNLIDNLDILKTITDSSKNNLNQEIEIKKVIDNITRRQNNIEFTITNHDEYNTPQYITNLFNTSFTNINRLQPMLKKYINISKTLSIEDLADSYSDKIIKIAELKEIYSEMMNLNNYLRLKTEEYDVEFRNLNSIIDKLKNDIYIKIKDNTIDSVNGLATSVDPKIKYSLIDKNISTDFNHNLSEINIDETTNNIKIIEDLSLVYKLKESNDIDLNSLKTIISKTSIDVQTTESFEIIKKNTITALKNKINLSFQQTINSNLTIIKTYSDYLLNLRKVLNKIYTDINIKYTPIEILFDEINSRISNDSIVFKDMTSKDENTINHFYNLFYKNPYSSNNSKKELLILNEFNNKLRTRMLILANKQNVITRHKLHKIFDLIKYTSNEVLQDEISKQGNLLQKFGKIDNILRFLSNIQNLNNTETFEYILNMLSDEKYKSYLKLNDQNVNISNIIIGLQKYTIIDQSENSIEIDAASILSDFADKYNKTSGWGGFINVGLNQNIGFNSNITKSGNRFFSTASEKIGIKYRWFSDNYKREWINHYYGMIYLSGIIYEVTNATSDGFDSSNIGGGLGLNFFNSLEVNIHAAVPLEKNFHKKVFIGLSFDIPLSEYLKRL